MKYFITNIEEATADNQDYRRELFTGKQSQLVLMNLRPGEEIGMEVHELDQFIRFEAGEGKVEPDGEAHDVHDGIAVVIPAWAKHNVINTSSHDLKLYSIYSPPEHKVGTLHKTKQEAEKDTDHHFDGRHRCEASKTGGDEVSARERHGLPTY